MDKEPILPPEGKANRGRFESADLNLEEFEFYLKDTKFESFSDIVSSLAENFSMYHRESFGDIQANMTREINAVKLEKEVQQLMEGINHPPKKWEEVSIPLSGSEPEELFSQEIATLDGKIYLFKLFDIANREMAHRYEFTLDEISK